MSRRNRVLLALFVLLAGGALALEQPWRGDAYSRTQGGVRRLFPELEAQRESLARVEIRAAGQQATLTRSGGGFVVEEKLQYPADLGRLVSLVDALAWVDDRDTVSSNPDKRATYHVDEEGGTRIRLLDAKGGVLADAYGGSLRSAPESAGPQALLEFYLRRSDRDEVVLAPEFRPPAADPALWIEPRLFPGLQAAKLGWIERSSPDSGEAWRLERASPGGSGDPQWRMTAPEERDAAAHVAEGFVSALAGLSAQDVAARVPAGREPGPEFGIPTDILRAGLGDQSVELRLGKPAGEGRRYAWVPGSSWIVTIGEFAAERLRVTADKF